jgi:pyruvate kinase
MDARLPQIICTLGTTTDDAALLAAMAGAGMGMARVNTAYGSLDELRRRIRLLRAAAPGVELMLDLKGPQLRIECDTERVDRATGLARRVPCRYPIARGEVICVGFGPAAPVRFSADFRSDLAVGDRVTFQNGTIVTRVADPAVAGVEPRADAVLLEVLEAGEGALSPQMGANVPGKRLSVPRLSARDREALELGVAETAECYALSFVREPEDLLELHGALSARGEERALLCAKIEEQHGIDGLEEIVAAGRACGRRLAVMVARGDLFVELPPVKLPAIQSTLLRRCAALGAPAIVATGLLRSMQEGPRPSRAEVCDVAAALREGASSLLLSDETSNGKNPELVVRALAELCAEYGGGR